MTTYKEYQQQIEQLKLLAEAARGEEIKEAKEKIAKIMREHNLTLADLQDQQKSGPKRKHAPSGVLYKDPETGKTWTGRGRMPFWIEGKNRDDFLVS